MTDALIERLEERKKLKYMAPSKMDGGQQLVSIDDLYETVDELKAKDAEIAELREALGAFVNVRDQFPETMKLIDKKMGEFAPISVTVTKAQFRAARKALGGSDGE